MRRHQAAKSVFSLTEIGRMIGVSAQSMSKYSRLQGFPAACDKSGKREAMPVIQWWFLNRAPKRLQRQLHSELRASLGLSDDGTATVSDEMSASDRLDLALKAHKVARAVGDCVSFADIRAIVSKMAANIRQACAGVNSACGRDVLPLFDEAFNEFEAELDDEIDAIQQGSA